MASFTVQTAGVGRNSIFADGAAQFVEGKEKLWTTNSGLSLFSGLWFYRGLKTKNEVRIVISAAATVAVYILAKNDARLRKLDTQLALSGFKVCSEKMLGEEKMTRTWSCREKMLPANTRVEIVTPPWFLYDDRFLIVEKPHRASAPSYLHEP